MKYLENSSRECKVYGETSLQALLLVVMNAYMPMQGKSLTIQELRQYNKAFDILERDHEGVIPLEDGELAVVKKVVGWMSPLIPAVMRDAPFLEDMLNGARDTASDDS